LLKGNIVGDRAMRPASEWNPGSPEVKAIAEACRKRITAVVPAARVILYGSRARGDAHSDSDYDLLVLLPEGAGAAEELAIDETLYALELQEGAVVSTVMFPRATWNTPPYRAMPLHQAVDREGVLL
jgi:predicted nucleotidyltransferase